MEFTCSECGARFSMPESVMERYPGWKPRKCRKCHDKKDVADTPASGEQQDLVANADDDSPDPVEATQTKVSAAVSRELQRLVACNTAGPTEGVFTDGGCSGNPGPGGWGAVRVRGSEVINQMRGEHPNTTNNRMELIALMAGFRMLGPDEEETVWTDSQLCVNTFNEWAPGWMKRGWRRKGGPIKNLDLIKPLYRLIQSRPKARLRWIKAHVGSRWNEYADLLATAHLKH